MSKTDIKQELEVIESALFEMGVKVNSEDNPGLNILLNSIEDSYVLVPFPEVQEYMEEDWFYEEAILDITSKVGGSSYFIPMNRII